MISRSAASLVATCTATFGLHSSSSTTCSYSYFALASALRNRTAKSDELRPPRPLAEVPPVSGPIKPTLTLSFASTAAPDNASNTPVNIDAVAFHVLVILLSRGICGDHRRGGGAMKQLEPPIRRKI